MYVLNAYARIYICNREVTAVKHDYLYRHLYKYKVQYSQQIAYSIFISHYITI